MSKKAINMSLAHIGKGVLAMTSALGIVSGAFRAYEECEELRFVSMYSRHQYASLYKIAIKKGFVNGFSKVFPLPEAVFGIVLLPFTAPVAVIVYQYHYHISSRGNMFKREYYGEPKMYKK